MQRNAVLACSCPCVGLGHFPVKLPLAETFFPQWPNGRRNAMQYTSLPFSAPAGQTVVAMQRNTVRTLSCVLSWFGPFSAPAVGCGTTVAMQCNAVLAFLALVGFGSFFAPAVSCGILHFAPAKRPLQCNAMQCNAAHGFSYSCWVWAILRSSRWLTTPLLRTDQTVASMQRNARALQTRPSRWALPKALPQQDLLCPTSLRTYARYTEH